MLTASFIKLYGKRKASCIVIPLPIRYCESRFLKIYRIFLSSCSQNWKILIRNITFVNFGESKQNRYSKLWKHSKWLQFFPLWSKINNKSLKHQSDEKTAVFVCESVCFASANKKYKIVKKMKKTCSILVLSWIS